MNKSEGPVLALGCLGATILVLGLILGALAGDGVVRGICMIPIGLGFILARRAIADVAPAFSWPVWKGYVRVISVLFGVALICAGIWEISVA